MNRTIQIWRTAQPLIEQVLLLSDAANPKQQVSITYNEYIRSWQVKVDDRDFVDPEAEIFTNFHRQLELAVKYLEGLQPLTRPEMAKQQRERFWQLIVGSSQIDSPLAGWSTEADHWQYWEENLEKAIRISEAFVAVNYSADVIAYLDRVKPDRPTEVGQYRREAARVWGILLRSAIARPLLSIPNSPLVIISAIGLSAEEWLYWQGMSSQALTDQRQEWVRRFGVSG